MTAKLKLFKDSACRVTRDDDSEAKKVNVKRIVKKSLGCQTESIKEVSEFNKQQSFVKNSSPNPSISTTIGKNISLAFLKILQLLLIALISIIDLVLELTLKIKKIIFFPIFLFRYVFLVLAMPFSNVLILFPLVFIVVTSYYSSIIDLDLLINFFTHKLAPIYALDDLSHHLAKIKGIISNDIEKKAQLL